MNSPTFKCVLIAVFVKCDDWEPPEPQENKLKEAWQEPVNRFMNVDWRNTAQEVTSVLKDQMTTLKDVDWKKSATQINKAIKEPVKTLREAVIEEVRTADIRLIRKDPGKTTETHPILESASLEVSQANSIFETGWMDFYTWVSDLDTEYKPIEQAESLFSSPHYNNSLSTILILHDRCGNAKDHSVLKIVEALKLRNYDVNYNIMIMDFEKFMCGKFSPDSGLLKIGLNPQVKVLTTAIGEFLHRGIEQRKIRGKQINILGLGVSTDLAALVARHVKQVSRKRLKSILGIDPPVSLRRNLFNKDFAKYIHIYHTFKLVPGLDPNTGRATADFVFGGAKRGPQCKKSTITTTCYKGFGVQLFVATLLYPKLFAGRWCPSYYKFSQKFCDGNDYTFVVFPPDKQTKGVYHMDINYEFPYGRGLEGINENDDDDVSAGSLDGSKLSVQEYYHRLEMAVADIRSELMGCMHGVMTPSAAMRCVMAAQPAVRKLVKQQLIKKISCEELDESPTGKSCHYETRTKNNFDLPF